MSSTTPLVFISGLGPATVRALALRFGRSYDVVILSPHRLKQLGLNRMETPFSSGQIYNMRSDFPSSFMSLPTAVSRVRGQFPSRPIALGLLGFSGCFSPQSHELIRSSHGDSISEALMMHQAIQGPYLYSAVELSGTEPCASNPMSFTEIPPTILFVDKAGGVIKTTINYPGNKLKDSGLRFMSRWLAAKHGAVQGMAEDVLEENQLEKLANLCWDCHM